MTVIFGRNIGFFKERLSSTIHISTWNSLNSQTLKKICHPDCDPKLKHGQFDTWHVSVHHKK